MPEADMCWSEWTEEIDGTRHEHRCVLRRGHSGRCEWYEKGSAEKIREVLILRGEVKTPAQEDLDRLKEADKAARWARIGPYNHP